MMVMFDNEQQIAHTLISRVVCLPQYTKKYGGLIFGIPGLHNEVEIGLS